MAASPIDPFLEGKTGSNARGLLRIIILLLIAAAAVSSRLFSVISMLSIQNLKADLVVKIVHC